MNGQKLVVNFIMIFVLVLASVAAVAQGEVFHSIECMAIAVILGNQISSK